MARRSVLVGMAVILVTCAPDPSDQATDGDKPPLVETRSNEPKIVSSPQAQPAFKDLERGWTKLPPPPEARSATAATAWTGDRLIVWGGYVYTGYSDEVPQSDGFMFDARSREWNPMARSPLAARVVAASAWTGAELLIWGGSADSNLATFLDDGAAYDPATDSWRELPRAPISPRAPLSVWTGREFILWGTAVRVDARPRDGAAYDPIANTWRRIPPAPIELTDATASWTGKEMIVFGAALHGGNKPETETAVGAAYDPATDRWRQIPDSDLSPQASTAAWDGHDVIAWDYLNGSAAYEPEANEWRSLPRVPLDDYECSPQSVSVGRYIFGDYCGLMAVYDPNEGRWHDVSRREFAGWGFTIVAADQVVLLIGRNVDTEEEAMFAYRPPTW